MPLSMEDLDVMLGDPETTVMDSEYRDRQEAGTPNPLDHANTAVRNADTFASVLCESDHAEAAERRFRIARGFAAIAAQRFEAGLEFEAGLAAKRAERVALSIRDMDTARFEGIALAEPLGSNSAKRAAQLK
jgi:hypothetical protein